MKSMKETAEVLNIHWRTVRNMILRGQVKAVKIGSQWRIDDAEIERLKRGE